MILYRQADSRGNYAGTLNNISGVYARVDDHRRALDFLHRALPAMLEVGDRSGEALTRYNLAMVHRKGGDLAQAVAEFEPG